VPFRIHSPGSIVFANSDLESDRLGQFLISGGILDEESYERAARMMKKTRRRLGKTLVALGGFNPHLTPKEDIDLYVDQVMDMDPSIMINLIENYDSYDATSWLHTIEAPTLILSGEQDRITPLEEQELMHQLIPEIIVILRWDNG